MERTLLSYSGNVILCRRNYPRISFRVPIDYAGFECFRPDWTLNLSANGLFVLTPRPLLLGEEVSLRFELPDLAVPIEASGRVVWVPGPRLLGAGRRHPQGMAIAFQEIDEKLQSILDQYVMVTLGLASIDTRIGDELPPHIRKELSIPDDEVTSPSVSIELGFMLIDL
jgi:uncharacterized protein (TIGR02266 family)